MQGELPEVPPLSSTPAWGKNPRKPEGGSLEVRGWPGLTGSPQEVQAVGWSTSF